MGEIPEGHRPEDFADALAYTLIGIDMAKPEIPLEVMMHAERLYDEGGYKTVPTIIAEAIIAERMDERIRMGIFIGREREAAILDERARISKRAYELAIAIMGGEDAPGYADSVPTEVLVEQLRHERAEQDAWTEASVLAERERCAKLAAAWKGHPADFHFAGKQIAAAIRGEA